MSRDSLRGFAHTGLLRTLLQSFLRSGLMNALTAPGKVCKRRPKPRQRFRMATSTNPGDMLMLLFYCIRISNY